MNSKKALAWIPLLFLLSSLVFSQSLVELAKKERERRAKHKGKKLVVVTNSSLKNLKRIATVSVSRTKSSSQKSPRKIVPSRSSSSTRAQSARSMEKEKERFKTFKKELEAKWNKAKEYVALLTLKMNALWQEYYSMDDMTPREKIQQEISATYLKLQKAQQEEAKAKKEFEDARNIFRGKNPL